VKKVYSTIAGVLVGIGAGAVAQPASGQSAAQLQVLVNDTVAQFQLAYRHNVAEQRRRYDEVAQVLAAWRQAPRNESNNQLLEDWLRGAIRNSMPGSQAPLPQLPQFDQQQEHQEINGGDPPAATTLPTSSPLTESGVDSVPGEAQELDEAYEMGVEKTAGDPFGDDPEEAKGEVE
jgi:hypothetical protein